MTRQTTYQCIHCGKPHPTAYLARLCFELDMNNLRKEKSGIVPVLKYDPIRRQSYVTPKTNSK